MPRAAFSQIANRSMAEVLTRSLATSFAVLLPVGSLLFFGGETLKDFAFALLVGVASGAYSSIFIATPVLVEWKEREPVFMRRRRLVMEEHGGLVPAFAPATVGAARAPAAAPAPVADASLKSRWPDVVEQVKSRNPILASLLGSAQPVGLDDNLLTVSFGTDFNRKSAEKASHRQIIETAFERVYGTPYRLRCTVGGGPDAAPSLLDDPVINYAQRTFGGEPKRL
jgi:hypothetical protein